MASASFESPHVELWGQPEIKRPEPLRIVKERANTIAGSSTSGEVSMPRRGSVGHPNAHGSSPEGPNKSLTVFKRRRARGSVLDGSLEWNFYESPISSKVNHAAEPRNLPQENNGSSSRIRQSSARTVSVGSFLKSELFRESSESELNISCPQPVRMHPLDQKDTINPLKMELFPPFKLDDLGPNEQFSSRPSARRKSIGKKLVSKAFDGLGNARSKSMHFLRSKSSKDSLLRQVSLRNLETSRQFPSEASSRSSSRFSFEQESVLIRDSSSNSVMSADSPPLLTTLPYILYPEVTVIPEVDTVDFSNEVYLWVAVVVTGVLRKTADCDDLIQDTLLTSNNSSMSEDEIKSESTCYGCLYGVDITLAARKGCVLESVIAEHDQPRSLHLGQTELTLAKVKLLVGRRSSAHVRESSKELIAELESQLGNATTEYLTISISYKHSAFPTSRSSTTAIKGLSYHATTMRIEAHAVIKRHCSESSWSRQTSKHQDSRGASNPLFSLITAHCSPTRAARLLSTITHDHMSLAEVHRRDIDTGRRCNSSSDTVTPIKRKSSEDVPDQVAQLDSSVSLLASKQSLDITQAGFHDIDYNLGKLALNPCSDPDPARKIWSDMRKTSRGAGKRGSRVTGNPDTDVHCGSSGNGEVEVTVQKEQARLIELALRNKRSLGADTLRSMATPSMSMGLGMGRGWSWGPPWW